METYLTLMLIRFVLTVGGLVVPALLVFAIALTLKRGDRHEEVRRYTDPALKAGPRAAARRLGGRKSGAARSSRQDGR